MALAILYQCSLLWGGAHEHTNCTRTHKSWNMSLSLPCSIDPSASSGTIRETNGDKVNATVYYLSLLCSALSNELSSTFPSSTATSSLCRSEGISGKSCPLAGGRQAQSRIDTHVSSWPAPRGAICLPCPHWRGPHVEGAQRLTAHQFFYAEPFRHAA